MTATAGVWRAFTRKSSHFITCTLTETVVANRHWLKDMVRLCGTKINQLQPSKERFLFSHSACLQDCRSDFYEIANSRASLSLGACVMCHITEVLLCLSLGQIERSQIKIPTSRRRFWLDTIITLGGSPTAVAAPPILVKITSAIRTCLGSRLSTSHNLQIRRGQKKQTNKNLLALIRLWQVDRNKHKTIKKYLFRVWKNCFFNIQAVLWRSAFAMTVRRIFMLQEGK